MVERPQRCCLREPQQCVVAVAHGRGDVVAFLAVGVVDHPDGAVAAPGGEPVARPVRSEYESGRAFECRVEEVRGFRVRLPGRS